MDEKNKFAGRAGLRQHHVSKTTQNQSMKNKLPLTAQPVEPIKGWVRLMDSHWVNICNAPSVISAGTDTDAAVAEAVRLTESKLKEINSLAQPVESPFIAQ